MGMMKNIVSLLLVQAFGVYVLYLVVKYVFGVDLDFSTPHGKLLGLGLAGAFLYMFYLFLFEPNMLAWLGATAMYNPNDPRRIAATSPKPMAF